MHFLFPIFFSHNPKSVIASPVPRFRTDTVSRTDKVSGTNGTVVNRETARAKAKGHHILY